MRLSLFEIFLIETAAWLALWLLSDYVATLLTLSLGAIVLVVLVIALLAEWIERSKVPRRYFHIMGVSLVSIAASAALYMLIFGGRLDFLQRGL